MIQSLIDAVTVDKDQPLEGLKVVEVVMSTPSLVVLYQEDIRDALECNNNYAQRDIIPTSLTKGYVNPSSSVAGIVGNSCSVCSNYKDVEGCEGEEREMPPRRVFTVEYNNSSLHVRLQTLTIPLLEYEPYNEEDTMMSFDFNCLASIHGGNTGGPYDPEDPDDFERYIEDMSGFLGIFHEPPRIKAPLRTYKLLETVFRSG